MNMGFLHSGMHSGVVQITLPICLLGRTREEAENLEPGT